MAKLDSIIAMDALTGAMCLLIGVSFLILHITSSPTNGLWPTLPRYVRSGFFFTGLAMIYRGINLFNLSNTPPPSVGSINAQGFAVTCCMAFTIVSLAIYNLRQTSWLGITRRWRSITRAH